jgi:hypothetical protein
MRRQIRDMDARAWMVAHLMLATGNLPRGTRLGPLMRQLLGREPGQPVEMTTAATPEPDEPGRLSPEASVTYMKAWLQARGGQGRAESSPRS